MSMFRMASIALLAACGSAPSLPSPMTASTVVGRDFEAWASVIRSRHPNLSFKLPRADFDQMVQSLKSDEATLGETAFLARWWRIVSAIGDEHTWVHMPELGLMLPVRTRRFPDGLYVVDTDAANADLLGSRVDDIAGIDALQFQERLRPYVTSSVEPFFRVTSAELLWSALKLWQGAGLLPEANQYTLKFTKADGSTVQRTLHTTMTAPPTHVSTLLRDEAPAQNYFMRELTPQHVVYVRYRRCVDMPAHRWSTFANEIIAALEHTANQKLVLDLRGNGGGDSRLIQPLLDWLSSSSYNTKERLVVLIDAGVFSSALLNAVTLRSALNGTLVGDDAGQALSHYGEVVVFSLPSGRQAYNSTKRFDVGPVGTSDPFHAPLEPDVRIVETIADFRAGNDPVLTEVLR